MRSATTHFLAPGKRILHDDRLDVDELIGWVGDHHDDDVPVALHCVTHAQLVVALAALRSAGGHPRDRIEHAAVVPDDMVADLVDVGVTVVTQPNFVAERGEHYLRDVPIDEHPQLWRVASLLRAGIPMAASTDAPFGGMDPWAAMRAAVHRTTAGGDVLGPDERISAEEALRLFLGHPTGRRCRAPSTSARRPDGAHSGRRGRDAGVRTWSRRRSSADRSVSLGRLRRPVEEHELADAAGEARARPRSAGPTSRAGGRRSRCPRTTRDRG